MRRGLTLAVALAALPAIALSVWADEQLLSLLGRHELLCPVCRKPFTAVSSTQTNTRGGVDRDLFARALGSEPEYYRVSTCPRCGYSGYLSDFDPEMMLTPDFKDRVLRDPKLHLPAGFTPESDPRALDAADRYRLAIQCYQWAQRSDEALAWLNLRASWIARDEGSILPKDPKLARVMEYIERWRPALGEGDNQADIETGLVTRVVEALDAGRFNRFQRPYVELAVTLILRRHGENRQAGPMLERLARYEPFGDALRGGIERMRTSIAKERELQAEAAACFERAMLAGQVSPANRGTACYLLGELCRRLGRDGDAARWYDQALSDKGTPPDVRRWAGEQRRQLAAR
jgi:tetratricopeptide (TPR) repeat protein